jgi:signal recognition particle receptor subunit beta
VKDEHILKHRYHHPCSGRVVAYFKSKPDKSIEGIWCFVKCRKFCEHKEQSNFTELTYCIFSIQYWSHTNISSHITGTQITMSLITSLLASIFGGKEEYRILFLGLDASGRTTALYKLKLGEVVTTLPTIGFNVETIDVAPSSSAGLLSNHKTTLTVWDVGGCDKIRPLWRHYYAGLDGIVFFIDGCDRERMFSKSESDRWSMAQGLFEGTLAEEVLQHVPALVFVNKQDLEGCISPHKVRERLNLDQYRDRMTNCMGCCATSGDGLMEGLQWLTMAMAQRRTAVPTTDNSSASSASAQITAQTSSATEVPAEPLTPEQQEAQKMEQLMNDWLQRKDDDPDTFIQQLDDATLDTWDHYTHLRIAWLLLNRHGRRQGMLLIFEKIKSFIERSPRTKRGGSSSNNNRGTTFHETMTYFWVHMVDYSMKVNEFNRKMGATDGVDRSDGGIDTSKNFKHFLLFNPHLCNGGLFLHYYSKQLMLLNADARTTVLLPDVRPLPSFLSSHAHNSSADGASSASASVAPAAPVAPVHLRLQPRAPYTDEEFLLAFNNNNLGQWGHDSKIRLIYLLLSIPDVEPDAPTDGIAIKPKARRNTDKVLDSLRSVEKGGFHMTESYFWLQMVSYQIALMHKEMNIPAHQANVIPVADIPSFDTFYRRPICQSLRNALLVDKHYSRKLIDSDEAFHGFVLPDLKPLPSLVR